MIYDDLYCLFGEIFENIHYIEWNLALIISKSRKLNTENLFEKMQTMTMGEIISYARNVEYFEKQDLKELEYILEKRNYLAHHFFKKNDIVKNNDNTTFLQNKVNELAKILTRFQDFNDVLSEFY